MRLVVSGILALAVSASLTPANATSGGGNRPCFLSAYSSRIAFNEWPCHACVSQCRGYGKPSPANGYGKPSSDIFACVTKCTAAKRAAGGPITNGAIP
jgi:hypothetical protein